MAEKSSNRGPGPYSQDDLSDKEDLFCREFAVDRNGTRAAIAAKYSERNAAQQASRMLRKAKIRHRIDQLLQASNQRLEIDVDSVIEEARRIAEVDPREIFDENGDILPPKQWSDEIASAISHVEVVKDKQGNRKYKVSFWSKTKGVELVGRTKAVFKDNVNVNLTEDLANRMAAARANAKKRKEEKK